MKLRLEYRKASELSENPQNWRKHSIRQKKALKAILNEVGWAGAVLYNERTGRLIDGHLRKELAEDDEIPVLIGDWTEEEEQKILATFDPIGSMALTDHEKLSDLIEGMKEKDYIKEMFGYYDYWDMKILQTNHLEKSFAKKSANESSDSLTIYCPNCGYEF